MTPGWVRVVVAGFPTPAAALPLIVVADAPPLVSASTLPDGDDYRPLIPVLSKSGAQTKGGETVVKVGMICGGGYLLAPVALAIWTVPG